MATINPYLHFLGNTAGEAFNFYKSVFGGDFSVMQRFKDMPPEAQQGLSPADAEKLMHIALPIGGNVLMGNDAPEFIAKDYVAGTGSIISLSVSTKSEAEANQIFEGLSAGGEITMPIQEMFWGAYFGMLTDKFGIEWMVEYDEKQQH